jgi:hypothetical protein
MPLLEARERVVSDVTWAAFRKAEAAHKEAKDTLKRLEERARAGSHWAWVFGSDAGAGAPRRGQKGKRSRTSTGPPRIMEPIETSETYAAEVELLQRAAALRTAQAAVDREFHERMAVGTKWVASGCRGSPMAPPSAIPAAAWIDLQVTDWERSRLTEPDGTAWYRVGVESAAPVMTGTERELAQIFREFPREDLPWKDYCEEVRERLRGSGVTKLPEDRTIQNYYYAWHKEQPVKVAKKAPKKASKKVAAKKAAK